MSDIPRKRPRMTAPAGMSSVGGVEDRAAQQALQQLQENIELLARKIEALRGPAAEAEMVDLGPLWDELRRLKRAMKEKKASSRKRYVEYLGKVETLPPLPAHDPNICTWVSTGGGTGDDQDWYGRPGASKWTVMENTTNKSGTPV